MWKKVCISLVLGLALSPVAAMAGDFDPFEVLTAGISQGMAVGDNFSLESNYDEGSTQGGNVIIGDTAADVFQGATVETDLALDMSDGNDNVQGLNVIQGKIAVLALQGAAVYDDVTISSVSNKNSVQAVNVVVAP